MLRDGTQERWLNSKESKDCIRNWIRHHSCNILAKNLILFFPCSENLSQVEFKSNKLICLTEEISRQGNIQASSKKVVVTANDTNTIEEKPPCCTGTMGKVSYSKTLHLTSQFIKIQILVRQESLN